MKKILAVLVAGWMAGCASAPSEIEAAYVSPLQYQGYTCSQIEMELRRVGRRVAELQTSLEAEAGADTGQMAAGLIIFWPALFFLEGGDGPAAQEYAYLKGQRNALEDVAIGKDCGITVVESQVAVRAPSAGRQSDAAIDARTEERNRNIRDNYGHCLVDAMVRYDDAESSTFRLVRRAQDACTLEAKAWQEIYVEEGRSRRQVERVFAQAMEDLRDDLVPMVEDYRARGIPLSEVVDLM